MPISEHLRTLSHLPAAFPVVGDGKYKFVLDHRISSPSHFRIAFVILLDGDLVMSPEHLGVALMTAVLREHGFTAKIFEVEHGNEGSALESILRFDPAFVCFTLMSLNIASCQVFAKMLRLRKPEAVIACGGPAGTYASLAILEQIPEADIVAIGEGEPTIFELVQRLYLKEPLESCAGICFRSPDGELRQNQVRALIHNLDDLPFAVRDQFELHGNSLEYMRVSTSRGCVARCTFCSAPNVSNKFQSGKAWRARTPQSVLAEIEMLVKKYNYRTFDFIDSTFEDPDGGRIGKTRVAEIARGLLERNLDVYYNCCMRAENWDETDEDLLALMVESGLEKVNVGIESGTAWELKLWDKLATVEDNIRMIQLLRKHGIYLAMGFIQFHPYCTVESLRSNGLFLRDYAGHNLRRLTERLEVYPGTVILARMEEDGLLDADYFETLNPYGYRFQDERVQKLATHFASLYNNDDYHKKGVITEQSAVFRFETFNVVLETFVSRIRRKFRHIAAVQEELNAFVGLVYSIRQEIAQFNHSFFVESLEAVLEDRFDARGLERQIQQIEQLFQSAMDRIRTAQLKTGRRLMRAGADVTQISSSIPVPVAAGAPRTYTGGAPCW